ncbi:hypothetical protein [Sphingobium sp. 15-1]|uniref:hypothetical protein n=1 Tax=Sphingobium sp. 15-1 TaxID=2729616 RepID=UPI00159C5333|nr:hypothetical protein [Sphingobium sp. 15-1]
MMRRFCRYLGFASLMVPGHAWADCQPSFVDGPREVRLAAGDSMDQRQLTEPFRIMVRNDGDSECRLRLRVTRDLGASDASFPNYMLNGPGGNISVTSASPADVSSGGGVVILQPHGRTSVGYTVNVPVNWGMRSGDYRQQLVFALSEDSGNVPLDEVQLRLKLEIPATARIRFAGVGGEGGTARIDLGELSTTMRTVSQPFAVRVLSTSGYQLRFASQYGGVLRRIDGPEVIPYRLSVDGRAFNMATGDQINVGEHTGSQGDVHGISITVDPDPTWHAGKYTDRVTVAVTPI